MRETLAELRQQIAVHALLVDTPADQSAYKRKQQRRRKIVQHDLDQINHEFGKAEFNEAIDDFDLEALGWKKRAGQTKRTPGQPTFACALTEWPHAAHGPVARERGWCLGEKEDDNNAN